MRVHKQPGDGCWEWTAGTNGRYGKVRLPGREAYAHRAAYEDAHGPLPAGMHLHHLCGEPRCLQTIMDTTHAAAAVEAIRQEIYPRSLHDVAGVIREAVRRAYTDGLRDGFLQGVEAEAARNQDARTDG